MKTSDEPQKGDAGAQAGSDTQPINPVADVISDAFAAELAEEMGMTGKPAAPDRKPEVKQEGAEAHLKTKESKAEPKAKPDDPEAKDEPSAKTDTETVPKLFAPDDEEENDDEGGMSGGDAPDAAPGEQTIPLKRLHKQVSKTKALEQRVKELEAQLAGGNGAAKPILKHDSPEFLDNVPDVAEAKASMEWAQRSKVAASHMLRQMADDPDGVRARLKEMGVSQVPVDDAVLSAQLEDTIDQFAAQESDARVNYRISRQLYSRDLKHAQRTSDVQAHALYPWMNDTGSTEYAKAQELIAASPAIMQRHDRGLIIGRYVTGLMSEQGHAKAPTRTAAPTTVPKPPHIPSPSAVPAGGRKVSTRDQDTTRQLQEALKSDDEDLVDQALGALV